MDHNDIIASTDQMARWCAWLALASTIGAIASFHPSWPLPTLGVFARGYTVAGWGLWLLLRTVARRDRLWRAQNLRRIARDWTATARNTTPHGTAGGRHDAL